jgi:hypothetical protein
MTVEEQLFIARYRRSKNEQKQLLLTRTLVNALGTNQINRPLQSIGRLPHTLRSDKKLLNRR